MLLKVWRSFRVFEYFIILLVFKVAESHTARDCIDLLELGFKEDGIYLIDPDNNGSFHVFCDQTTNGGGWLVFQNRYNGSEDFNRKWADYKNGFGDLGGEFWLGNDKIHRLTNRHQQLLVELEGLDNYTAHAQYNSFSVDSEENWYTLHLGYFSGTAKDNFAYHSNAKFSASDQDNDDSDRHCAKEYSCGWWFRNCFRVNLNGKYTTPTSFSWKGLIKGNDKHHPLKSSSMKIRSVSGKEWDYSIDLLPNRTSAHAQMVVKVSQFRQMTACWWLKPLISSYLQNIAVFSFGDAKINDTLAFIIANNSAIRITLNATHNDFEVKDANFLENHWHHMCLTTALPDGVWKYYMDGALKKWISGHHSNLTITPGSILRIGLLSGEISGETNIATAEMSQMNIWDNIIDSRTLFLMSRGCNADIGSVVFWPVVQLWLYENVTKKSPSSCTGADNIHWTLSTSNGASNITDDSSSWKGHVVGDGVTMDPSVMSLQGRGHVILGSFEKNCPGSPQLCKNDFSVSFWMKYGVKFTSYILGQNEKYHQALESMVSEVTPNFSTWTRCYHAKSDGFTAYDFHSRCDNKGPTITLVRVREFVFGGFLDQNWGGSDWRRISSFSAFIFSLNNPLGLEPFKMGVNKNFTDFAATHSPQKGPIFGNGDLTLGFDSVLYLRESSSYLGRTFSLPNDYDLSKEVYGFGLLAETVLFTWDDMEVFYYDVPHRALGVSDPGEIPDSAFLASSQRNPLDYSAAKALKEGANLDSEEWCSYYNDTNQWLQAKLSYVNRNRRLNKMELIFINSSIQLYRINTSMDGENWSFENETERKYVVLRPFNYIRIIPQKWNSTICMKIEFTPENSVIVDNMTASSERCMSPPHFGRLLFPGPCLSAWCSKPQSEDKYPWLRVDLGAEYYVLFVATQGSNSEQNEDFVFKYRLKYDIHRLYRENGMIKEFHGNWNGSTAVKNAILNPFKARYLTFMPLHDSKNSRPFGFCLRVEIYVPVDDESTIISWRSVGREFAYKQVNRLLTSYHQLSVLQRGKIQKLEIPTIPRGWHHVAFTSSLIWDLKFYQNGVLVNETGRVRPSTVETQADNLLIIGNRILSTGVKPADNFQIYGLTVWPRQISQPQIKEQLTEVPCRMTDWCLRNFKEDDFNWSFRTDCTSSWFDGPCSDVLLKTQVQRSYINGAFFGTTEQQPQGNSSLAVDGTFGHGTLIGRDQKPWWKVDLGREGLLLGVRLRLGAKIFGGGLATIKLIVFDANNARHFCASYELSNNLKYGKIMVYCNKALLGRYLQVQMAEKYGCTIPVCEYQMFLIEVDVMLDQSKGFLYIEPSKEYNGKMARLTTQFILPVYNCLSFSHHMSPQQIGKLSVYFKSYQGNEILLWRLVGGTSSEWKYGEISIKSSNAYQIIFEGIMGSATDGDIAIDNVWFTNNKNCSLIPGNARVAYSGDFRSAIIGRITAYKSRLESWLAIVGFHGKLWKPCYSRARDGRNSSVFHQRCDGRGPTLTIARVNNTIFGGFADENWGSSLEKYHLSTKSFLFRFERTLGEAHKDQVLGLQKVFKAIQWRKERGPIFGREEFGVSSDMNEATFSDLHQYASNRSNGTFLLNQSRIYIHDIEVLSIGDTGCASQCPLYQICDDAFGTCTWDLALRGAHFCDHGNPTYYWPLDDHTNVINEGGDYWGTFNGTVVTQRGPRLRAVYTRSDAVINLGEVRVACFTDPMSCVGGFTVSLWLRHWTVGVKQDFVLIRDKNKQEITFNVLQQDGITDEHLAVRVSASSRSCVYVFPVPQTIWSHYTFVWDKARLEIFRNGHKVVKFLNQEEFCTDGVSQAPVTLPVVILKGNAVFDDMKIWARTLQSNEVGEMYTCVRAPSWTCKLSDWSTNIKEKEISQCSEANSFLNGLQRRENGGLEDFFDRLEGGWCCSFPPRYQQNNLRCHYPRRILSGKEILISCTTGYYLYGLYRAEINQATMNSIHYGKCCRPDKVESDYGHCYDHYISPFDKPGLYKCSDDHFITEIRSRWCVLLHCIYRFRCCNMKTDDEQAKRLLETKVTVSLLDEKWSPELEDKFSSHFSKLQDKIKSGILGVYENVKKENYIESIAVTKFRPGSVISYFSIIFNSPYYELITPLTDAINQTNDNGTNHLGDMAIQLWNVDPVDVYGKSLNTTVTTMNNSTFFIKWESAEDTPDYGSFQGYQVLYKKGYTTAHFTVLTEINDNITEARLTGDECEQYSFKVRAFSLEGYGKLSEAVTVETSCKGVDNISATAVNMSSILIQWSQSRGSLVSSYNVTYRMVEGGSVQHVVNQRHVSQLYLVNLYGMTTYAIKVGLVNTDNVTIWSEEITVTKLPGTPTAPPENVTAYNLSSTSIMVTWLPVPEGFLNGELQSYRVFYRETTSGSYPSTEIVVGHTSLSVIISSLKKFTVYSVWVKAVTTKEGPSSAVVQVSTDEDVPSLSPARLTAFNTSSTSIQVLWQPIPANHIHGILLGYNVLYHIVKRAKRSVNFVTVNVTSLSVVIRDLLKFSEYRIMVSGFTSVGEGIQAETRCRTDENVPDSPPTNITTRSNNSTVLEVLWNPVIREEQNGIIRGYHLSLFETWGASLRNVTVWNASQSSYQFQVLKVWTDYLVEMCAFTSKGNGPYSSSVFARTDEDAPVVAPAGLTGHNTSASSIRVAWEPVATDDENIRGIHRGYKIYYKPMNTRWPPVLLNVTADENSTQVQLSNLHKLTNYSIHVVVMTKWDGLPSRTIYVSTDEGTPDLPPADVGARALGKTGIEVRWAPVPVGFRCGIIRGYKISFNSSNSTTRTITTSHDAFYTTLTSLTKFTFYNVYVQAFTAKGDGPAKYLLAATDMGVPSEAPPGLTTEDHGTTHSMAVKWQPLPPSNDYGVLSGYRLRYHLTKIGEVATTGKPTKELVVDSKTNEVLLQNLEMYGTYSIWLSAFTISGTGPEGSTSGKTCRCEKQHRTNWRKLPPYISNLSNADAPHPGGIIPGILHDMAVMCCQTCKSHGKTVVDFKVDGDGQPSKKSSDSVLRASISHKTDFTFPISGYTGQERFGEDFGYWPLVQTPGVAYIVNTGTGETPASALNNTLVSCWPAALLVFVTSILAGFLIWIADWKTNQNQFSLSVTRGPGEGFWWAFITMTTVGYGDKYAVTPAARLFTVAWIVTGLVIQSGFVATVTLSLVSQSLDVDFKLYGSKTAAIQDSFEYRFGLRRNARVNPDKQYTTYDEISEALLNGDVAGALIDTYVLGSRKNLFEKPSLRVMKIYDYSTTYGVVLGGESKKLSKCVGRYMQSHRVEIFQAIENHVDSVEESPIPLAVERSTGLLDSESPFFKMTVLVFSLVLVALIVLGALWELTKRLKRRRRVQPECDSWHDTRREMNKTVEDFAAEIKRLVEELKAKHSKERLQLLNALKSAAPKKELEQTGIIGKTFEQRGSFWVNWHRG